MPPRLSRRLAGCIVIELVLAPLGFAADFEFKAATTISGEAKALVLEDRRGSRAALVEARFAVTRAVSDFAGARLMQFYGLDRAGVLFRGVSSGEPRRDDLVTAVAAALGKLEPAAVRYGDGRLSVVSPDGRCVASLSPEGSLDLDRCREGAPVHDAIRFALQTFEPSHGLVQREATIPSYPVQAIAFGKQVTILGLPGEITVRTNKANSVIVVPFANDDIPLPAGPETEAAVRKVLARVK